MRRRVAERIHVDPLDSLRIGKLFFFVYITHNSVSCTVCVRVDHSPGSPRGGGERGG